MILLLIGLVFGWPLMIATISTQGSDAFDGFSRSFDYVYSRFWHLVWFLIVAAAYGLLMLWVVWGVTVGITELAAVSVGVGMGEDSQILNAADLAGRCVSAWLSGVALLVAGYAVSYFWSASTIIYFLLRQSEDANHLSEVYLPKEDQPDNLVQLAGVAASDQPIIERPAKHESETAEESTTKTEVSEEKPQND